MGFVVLTRFFVGVVNFTAKMLHLQNLAEIMEQVRASETAAEAEALMEAEPESEEDLRPTLTTCSTQTDVSNLLYC